MIRGTTKNIDFGIGAAKNDNPIEALLPKFVDRRNGQFTAAGNWKRRPGYAVEWNLGTTSPIDLLIPEEGGFAIARNGTIFDLKPNGTATRSAVKMTGSYRPHYTMQQATAAQAKRMIITDGGLPVTITFTPNSVAYLGGAPQRARFCDTLNDRVLLAGADELTFWWSDLTKPEEYPAENFNILKGDGEHIELMKVWGRNVYFWKDKSLEIWTDTGTVAFIGRQAYIERGTSSGRSVVFANNVPYWFDETDFFALNGATPTVISAAYSREIKKIENPGEVYGFHFEREKLIRWFAPHSNKCFVYDYSVQQFSEDNQWADGHWTRMPINSYMEWSGKAYFGDYEPTGKIYHWSDEYEDDNGLPIRLYRRFALPLSDTGHFSRANLLRFRMDRGNGTNATPTPHALIRWSMDKGPFISQDIDLGQVGEHYPYIDVHNLGIGQEIEIEEIISDRVETLSTHAYLTAEQLG